MCNFKYQIQPIINSINKTNESGTIIFPRKSIITGQKILKPKLKIKLMILYGFYSVLSNAYVVVVYIERAIKIGNTDYFEVTILSFYKEH